MGRTPDATVLNRRWAHRKYAPDAKPPQKQCPTRDRHDRHIYERDGLPCYCQGRGST